MGAVLGVSEDRLITLGESLWQSGLPVRRVVHTFSCSEEAVYQDIEAMAMPDEQRLPPPPRLAKEKVERVDKALDAIWRKLLKEEL